LRAVLHHIQPQTPLISTFWFRPAKPLRYIAGQFTELHLPHADTDNRGDKRWFTLSSSPTDELVSVTTRLDPEQPSSFKRTLFGLEAGAAVTLAEPMGDFVLPLDKDRPLVFAAVGLGITPIHSMIRWLGDTGQQRPITMLYATKTAAEAAFRPLLQQASIDFKLLEAESRLTSDHIAAMPHAQDNALVYISGPEPIIERFVAELPHLGVDSSRLVTDYFHGYTEFTL
jgi:ferredoxin-NADP reductase